MGLQVSQSRENWRTNHLPRYPVTDAVHSSISSNEPVHAITVETAEIAGMIGGEKVAKGVVLPMMIS
jgi:hypothetical protein